MARCPDCYGSSDEIESASDGKCRECHGTGKDPGLTGREIEGEEANCWSCRGTGMCQTCGGTGELL
jgi:hypothetical protein